MSKKLTEIPEGFWQILFAARVDSMVEKGYLECDASRIARAEISARRFIASSNPAMAVTIAGRIVWTFYDELLFGLDYPHGLVIVKSYPDRDLLLGSEVDDVQDAQQYSVAELLS